MPLTQYIFAKLFFCSNSNGAIFTVRVPLAPLKSILFSPHEHGLVDLLGEGEDEALGLDLLVEHHPGGDAGGEADALGHGAVAGGVAVRDQVDTALLATAVGPADRHLGGGR